MDNLFECVACFTDIHLGNKNNSPEHNQDCLDYINWFIGEAKVRGCETCICLGDFHHHRNTINVSTLNYSMKVLKLLSDNFKQVFLIVGNHDNYYRATRDITSLSIGSEFPNITVVNDILRAGGVALCPWLVEDEWRQVQGFTERYIFGHFEIPGFKMNAQIAMPDHGQIQKSHFQNQEYVFSGHFHQRQAQGNIQYIGNTFPHNFSDAFDQERGAMFLQWGGTPEYLNWEDAPRYVVTTLSTLLDNTDVFLLPKTYAKITMDINISFEEATFLKDKFENEYDAREIKFIPYKSEDTEQEFDGEITFQTIDQIVAQQLESIDSKDFDVGTLLRIYNDL